MVDEPVHVAHGRKTLDSCGSFRVLVVIRSLNRVFESSRYLPTPLSLPATHAITISFAQTVRVGLHPSAKKDLLSDLARFFDRCT